MSTELQKDEALKLMAVSLCSHACFRDEKSCPRANWNKAKEIYPLLPAKEECPVRQIQAELRDGDPEDHHMLSLEATWFMCEHCKYSVVKDGLVDIGPALQEHCSDCPVMAVRNILMQNMYGML